MFQLIGVTKANKNVKEIKHPEQLEYQKAKNMMTIAETTEALRTRSINSELEWQQEYSRDSMTIQGVRNECIALNDCTIKNHQ